MSKVSQPSSLVRQQGRVKLDEELDGMLAERESLVSTIAVADRNHAKRLAEIELLHQEELGTAPEELEKLDTRLATFLKRHRHWLTRRHSKTIVRPNGVIKEVLRAVELDKPANTQPVVDFLLARRGGKKFLRVKYELDLRKLLQAAPPGLKAELRRYGLWWGRHLVLSVKSSSDSEPKQLVRQRRNERS